MPMYEYVCEACDHRFEKLVSARQRRVQCPRCASVKVTKQFSRFALRGELTLAGAGGGCQRCSGGRCSCCGH